MQQNVEFRPVLKPPEGAIGTPIFFLLILYFVVTCGCQLHIFLYKCFPLLLQHLTRDQSCATTLNMTSLCRTNVFQKTHSSLCFRFQFKMHFCFRETSQRGEQVLLFHLTCHQLTSSWLTICRMSPVSNRKPASLQGIRLSLAGS